jgi:hypothetical protein
MPTISEEELKGDQGSPCTQCDEYEGAIFLCGEGYLCERCFAALAGIEEEELFEDDVPLLDFEIDAKHKARVKSKLMLVRGEDGG